MSDPYRVLGISPGSSDEDIKKAFRQLALKHHPDRHATAADADKLHAATQFKHITEAYEVLTDPGKRSAYDASGRYSSYGSSSAGSSRYNYRNVNTDWSGSGYGFGAQAHGSERVRISNWQVFKRAMVHGMRSWDAAFHVGMFVLLVGGGVMVHQLVPTIWDARNKGRRFEDIKIPAENRQGRRAWQSRFVEDPDA